MTRQSIWLIAWLLQIVLAYTSLSDESLRKHLLDPGNDFDIHSGRLLAPILQPRVPGTAGSLAVRTHLVDIFRQLLPAWQITFQNSTFTTPLSKGEQVPFINIIATRDPPGSEPGHVGRLVLVAHYDSKIEPEGFIGAVDSAAPCAMLLHIARNLDKALTAKWAAAATDDPDGLSHDAKGIQIILLDGEEAFETWTATDSIYGARALAAEWEQTLNPVSSTYRSPLDAIDLFLLLDLLGAAAPKVPSYFKTTHWAYQKMAKAESRLRSLGLFASAKQDAGPFLTEPDKGENERWLGGHMLDDHIPFMAKGVDVLHLIPSPFPHVWHTIEDDGEHLDMATVKDWTKLVAAFTAEWMELEPYMNKIKALTDRHLDTKDELHG